MTITPEIAPVPPVNDTRKAVVKLAKTLAAKIAVGVVVTVVVTIVADAILGAITSDSDEA